MSFLRLKVRSTGAEDVADPSLTAALAGRPLSRASSDPPPVVPAPVADMEPPLARNVNPALWFQVPIPSGLFKQVQAISAPLKHPHSPNCHKTQLNIS